MPPLIITLPTALLLGLAALLLVPPLRRALLTRPIFAAYRKALPTMSDTEREALEAGTVWWEGEPFRGKPDWNRRLAYPKPTLSAAEQAFLDGPVNEACALVADSRVTQQDYDISPATWDFIKSRGFLGMIIPKRYGGLESSACPIPR